LSPSQRQYASELLARWYEKHKYRMTFRLLGILRGTARREASKTPEERSAWGRKMLATRGGQARMAKCEDPRRLQSLASAARRCQAAREREKKKLAGLGLERDRVFHGNLSGI
jgi:hypothetical protein